MEFKVKYKNWLYDPKYQIEEKKIQVTTSREELLIRADRRQLLRALNNLVGNSINYIGDGSEKRIHIGWRRPDGPAPPGPRVPGLQEQP